MKVRPWLLSLLLFFSPMLLAAVVEHPDIRHELLIMESRDQDARRAFHRLDAAELGKEAVKSRVQQLQAIDRENTQRLEQIIARIGWPTPALVGDDGAGAAWLIAQHADQKPAFQKYVLGLLEPLVKAGQVKPSRYAYLYDRTHIPQRFGTQGRCINGTWVPLAIESVEKVESLRKEFQMQPFDEYRKLATEKLCRGSKSNHID
ncbi:DUF6624 domain-containing protein [Photobacterium sp. MCCC 1A19761]|uniref:DUF6624 domain-containing protein n=1 Tax=Photobacterium sp. MCCC 1A19761 TaxID=3115000 RepID=UPI00307D9797